MRAVIVREIGPIASHAVRYPILSQGRTRYRKRTPNLMAQCMNEIFEILEAGKLRPAPTATRPLDAFAKSLQDIVDRRVSGRIVLLPNP